MTETLVCCVCTECIGCANITGLITYTSCCTEPVCSDCQADLANLNQLSPQANTVLCPICHLSLTSHNLVDLVKLVETQRHIDIATALNRVHLLIKPYHRIIMELQKHLDSHLENIAELTTLAKTNQTVLLPLRALLNPTTWLAQLNQETSRVIKPLKTTVENNGATLTRLQHLQNQLNNLADLNVLTLSQSELILKQGRLLRITQQVNQEWPKPDTLSLPLLWHFRHPLGSSLIYTEPLKIRTTASGSVQTKVDDKLVVEAIASIRGDEKAIGPFQEGIYRDSYRINFQEVAPKVFLLLVGYKSDCYVFNLAAKLLTYIKNCDFDSVKINTKHLVYTETSSQTWVLSVDITKLTANQASVTKQLDLKTQAQPKLVDSGLITILALEQDQLWYYKNITNKLYRCDLAGLGPSAESGSIQSYSILPARELLSFHRGVYCVIMSETSRASHLISKETHYYLIKSIAYPDSYLESKREPYIFCDGSVFYHNGQHWCICHREDLTGGKSTGRAIAGFSDASELTWDGRLMTWFETETRAIYFTTFE